MRYAIYFTPPRDDPLTAAAARWLGRDAFADESVGPPIADGLTREALAAITAEPRRYGFHATLKAPFRLRDGESEERLVEALRDFCGSIDGLAIPRLVIGRIGPFFALVPREPIAALDELASAVVMTFDRFRAALSEAEIDKRAPEALTPNQRAHLARWGYPYVLDEFRFHLSLTGAVPPGERRRIERALHDWFDPVLDRALMIASLALFDEPAPGAPFRVAAEARLGRAPERKFA